MAAVPPRKSTNDAEAVCEVSSRLRQAGGVQFRHASALAPEEVAVIEEQVRRRVLRWFSRHGMLDPDDARDMLAWA